MSEVRIEESSVSRLSVLRLTQAHVVGSRLQGPWGLSPDVLRGATSGREDRRNEPRFLGSAASDTHLGWRF